MKSKHVHLKMKFKRKSLSLSESTSNTRQAEHSANVEQPQFFPATSNPYYDPLAHWGYETTLPHGLPTHISLSQIKQHYSFKSSLDSVEENLTDDPVDSNEMPPGPSEIDNILSPSQTNHRHPGVVSFCLPAAVMTQDHQKARGSMKLRSTSALGIPRVSTASSRYAKSVLAATDSGRSSTRSAMSYCFTETSSKKASLTPSEREVWHMTVEESALDSSRDPFDNSRSMAGSLLSRPCCGLSILGKIAIKLCDICDVCGSMKIRQLSESERKVNFEDYVHKNLDTIRNSHLVMVSLLDENH